MAFSTQGATPQTPQLPGLGGGALGGGTSQARALNTALQPNSGALKLTPTPAPTGQAIKKQTMTDTAGNTHTTEYHPPTSGMIGSSGGKPITGDTQTPSGATVNAESGQVKAPPPTYGGIIGSLAQTSQQGSPAAQGLIGASQGASQGAYGAGSAQEKEAYGKAQALNAQLSESRKNEANAEAQNRLNPIPIGDQTGREAVIRNQYLAQQNALSSELQGESNLANVGITGQGQGISGLNSAAGNANTAQGQTISGLGTAGNLAAPILGQPGQTNYGLGGGTGGLSPEVMHNYAQMAATGQYAAIPKRISSNPVLNDQLNQLAKKIDPNYSPIGSQALGEVQSQQTQQVEQYKSTLQQGQNLQSQLNDLIKTFSLNPNDLNAANAGIQKIAQNTSNPHYKQLQNYVNEVANTYAQALTPPGGSATDTTRSIASSMLDDTASGASLADVMRGMDYAVQAKIAGVPTVGAKKTQSSSSAFQEGQTSSDGSLVYQGGKWVVKK